ncbi:hypothetical protein C2845_PMPSC004510 [Panicum miliaceum]|uniref:Uncharacterized protein n=1 Tax=Panicum miliaceum TaxID=4540 RepID=A0A3L6PAU3_PANMI|nr:hypothetical protein C2845_PMPSC004510 [Panicum miliaceum]
MSPTAQQNPRTRLPSSGALLALAAPCHAAAHRRRELRTLTCPLPVRARVGRAAPLPAAGEASAHGAPAARRRRGLRAPAATQFVARPSDSSRPAQIGPPPLKSAMLRARSRREEQRMAGRKDGVGGSTRREETVWNWNELVQSFLRSEFFPNLERIFAWRDRSVHTLAKQTRDGTAPSRTAPEPTAI